MLTNPNNVLHNADTMKITDRLIKHYKGRLATAAALDIHEETLRLWQHRGIPLSKAIWLERRTRGIVTAEEILREAKLAA
jgi:hypothetical protein